MNRTLLIIACLGLCYGLSGCRAPESEPEFLSYIDSADVSAYNIEGERFAFTTEDCVWGVFEYDHGEGPLSMLSISCGDNNEIVSASGMRGHLLSEYKPDNDRRLGTPTIYVQDEIWYGPEHSHIDACKHDPDNNAIVVIGFHFEMKPADESVIIPDGFNRAYQASLVYQLANPDLDVPCFRINVQGGFFVKD